MTRCLLTMTVLAATCLASTGVARAQSSTYTNSVLGSLRTQNSVAAYSTDRVRRSVYNSAVPTNYFTSANRNIFNSALGGGTAASRPAKPFASVNRGSGPSPWLSLSDPYRSTANSYYSQVRPQLQAQAQGGRMANHAQQGASMSETPPYDPKGSDKEAPTGHVSTYMNFGGYYTPTRPTKAPARQ